MKKTKSQKLLYSFLLLCFAIGLLSSLIYIGFTYMQLTETGGIFGIAIIYTSKLLCFTFITYQLIRITNQFSAGEFFNKKTINALKITGVSLILCACINFLLQYVSIRSATNFKFNNPISFLSFYLSGPFTYFLGGLFTLLISKVFHEGLSLKEEQDLTI